MNYYQFFDKFGRLKGADTWAELDRGFVLRQISIKGDEVLASNRPHPEHGYFLPTGYIDYAAYNQIHSADIDKGIIKPVNKISPEKFDSVWQNHLSNHEQEWLKIKKNFSLNTVIQGEVKAFYPQGVIVKVNENVTGVANYERCRDLFGHTLVPNMPLQVTVGGFDERMQWLIFIEPHSSA